MTSRRDLFRAAASALVLPRDFWQNSLFPAPRPHVEVALKAARWIHTTRVPTERGVRWPADPNDPKSISRDLYNGYPGVVLFLLELFQTTADRQHLEEAVLGANEIAAGLASEAQLGLYTGAAGNAYVLEEVHRVTGDARYRAGATQVIYYLKQSARTKGAGIDWNDSYDIISGSAGIGLYMLRAGRLHKDDGAIKLAAQAGRRLLEVGEPANGGLKWAPGKDTPTKYPNFSHGAAGVGYFLATLYQATREQAFLDGALAAARYLDAVARKGEDGWKVFHHEPDGEELFYLSWCHGPAGTARLFYKLNAITKDKKWLDLVHKGARGSIAMGLPEERTPGYWNNISQCCGDCGVGEFFIALQRNAARPEYAEIVKRTAADTLKRATADGDGLKWVQAEHRVRPELLIAQTGFMQGAAGVGTFFLHADASERNARSTIVFPDNPWT